MAPRSGSDCHTSKIFTISGWSGSGKTTFLESLIPVLVNRGLRVGVIKHHGHSSPTDVEGADSARYSQAGASCTVLSSPIEYVVRRKPEKEKDLADLASEIANECDVILAEGFKSQAIRPIELCRMACTQKAAIDTARLFALITDSSTRAAEAQKADVPVFGLNDADELADFICLELAWEAR